MGSPLQPLLYRSLETGARYMMLWLPSGEPVVEGLEWVQADQLGSYYDSSGKKLSGLGLGCWQLKWHEQF